MRALAVALLGVLPLTTLGFVKPGSRRKLCLKTALFVGSESSGEGKGFLPKKLAGIADELRAHPNDIARGQALVKLGDAWAASMPSSPPPSSSPGASSLLLRRVPGCTAVVHLGIDIVAAANYIEEENEGDGVGANSRASISKRRKKRSASRGISPSSSEWVVGRVSGDADARLSQGLLALVALGFQGCNCADVLAADVGTLSARAGLASALTPSRNNGLASLLATLQAMIEEHLQLQQQEEGGQQQQQQQQKDQQERQNTAAVAPPPKEALGSGGAELAAASSLLTASSLTDAQQTTTSGVEVKTAADKQTSASSPALLGLQQEEWSGARSGAQHEREEVAVLLSGGVDSSVALRLALEAGYSCRCFYLKIWLEDELAHLNECPWEEDWAYALAVAKQANVPIEAVSMQRAYWDSVVAHTISEAKRGRTPNPDILCNSRVKFGMFYEQIGRHFSKVVTGHYARTITTTAPAPAAALAAETSQAATKVELVRSADPVKDQTYFLSALSQKQLERAWFPLGSYTKPEVRALAESFNLPTKARKDSQGICFLGKLKWGDFLAHYLPDQPGPVVELNLKSGAGASQRVGTHRGLHFHTVGQRKGVGPVLDPKQVHRGPWFVAAKDTNTNTLFVNTVVPAVVPAAAAASVVDKKAVAAAPFPLSSSLLLGGAIQPDEIATATSTASLCAAATTANAVSSDAAAGPSVSSPPPPSPPPPSLLSLSGGEGLTDAFESNHHDDGDDVVTFEVEDVNWIFGSPPTGLNDCNDGGDDGDVGLELVVQVRHGPVTYRATIWRVPPPPAAPPPAAAAATPAAASASPAPAAASSFARTSRLRVVARRTPNGCGADGGADGEDKTKTHKKKLGGLAAGQYAAFYATRRIPVEKEGHRNARKATAEAAAAVAGAVSSSNDLPVRDERGKAKEEGAFEEVEVCLGSGVICDQVPQALRSLIDRAAAAHAAGAVVVPAKR